MSIQYATAKEGKEFVPTYRGKKIGQISDKFRRSDQYRKRVPKRWITEEYVMEVNINDESEL